MYSFLGIAKVQRDITQNIYIQGLWFLRSAHHLMLVNISMTFHEDSLYGFQVTELQNGRHCILFLAFSRTILRQQGDYRAHYVNRFRYLLRAVQFPSLRLTPASFCSAMSNTLVDGFTFQSLRERVNLAFCCSVTSPLE